jgi:hypothetical protein
MMLDHSVEPKIDVEAHHGESGKTGAGCLAMTLMMDIYKQRRSFTVNL